MILDLNLAFQVCWGIQDLLWWENCSDGAKEPWFLLLMFLCLPPTIWLSLVLPALDISDWSLSFLWSWLCQNSSESSCLCDPVILGSCDPEILGVSELLGVKLTQRPWDPCVTKLLGSWDPWCFRVCGSEASFGCCSTGCRVCAQGKPSTDWKHSDSLVRQGSWVPGSCWSQLLPMLGQMLCLPHFWPYDPGYIRVPGSGASSGCCQLSLF